MPAQPFWPSPATFQNISTTKRWFFFFTMYLLSECFFCAQTISFLWLFFLLFSFCYECTDPNKIFYVQSDEGHSSGCWLCGRVSGGRCLQVFFRKYDNDNMKNYDTIKGASFLVIFSCLIFLSFQYFFAFARNITKSSSDPVGGMNLDMRW